MRKLFSFLSYPKVVLVILVLIVGSAGFYIFTLYQKSQTELNKIRLNPQTVAAEEGKSLVAKVGLLITLPDKEEPTIATVTDSSKLKDQPFFSKSENGDKVLIYTQAKKAILYRPGINKIIDVAPVNIGQPTPAQASITPSAGATRVPTLPPAGGLTPTLIPTSTITKAPTAP